VNEWFEVWATSRENKGLASVHDDRSRYKHHVKRVIGHRQMAKVTRAHVEEIVESLDAKIHSGELSWKTAANVWAVVTKMFKDSSKSKVSALRVRSDNPTTDVEGPDRGGEKNKAFLYPSEYLKLAACERVPLLWRRLITVAVYLGVRAGEQEVLDWSDFDLVHSKVTVHRARHRWGKGTKETKSQKPRTYTIEEHLLPLLRAMHDECGGKGPVFPNIPRLRPEHLREYLKAAGVRRKQLFISDATRLNLRWHDLRATAVTWMAVRGDSPALIMTRVGHEDWETLKKYMRQAEALADNFGDVFPKLPTSLLKGTATSLDTPTQPPKRGPRDPSKSSLNRLNAPKSMNSLSGARDSNPRLPAWEAGALPTELAPHVTCLSAAYPPMRVRQALCHFRRTIIFSNNAGHLRIAPRASGSTPSKVVTVLGE